MKPHAATKHPYLRSPGPIGFAHRGGVTVAPENTLAAFRSAWDTGFRYLETDVHLSADGVVVAFHDTHLDRVTDSTGPIADLPWHRIAEAVVGADASVPRLDELLETFPDARFNIDAKSDAVVEPLVDLVERFSAYERVCVASFHDHRVRRAQTLAGGRLCTSAGRRALLYQLGRAFGAPLPQPTSDVLQIPDRVGRVTMTTRRFVDRAHADGYDVHVWTLNAPEDMHRVLDIGVDGVMTDRPDVLKEVLIERGAWHPR